MNADSWTYQRIALSSAETDSAITRFMVTTGASDMASVTIWVDDVTVTRAQSEHWERINPKFWGVDQDARALVFEDDATLPYALLRITGRRADRQSTRLNSSHGYISDTVFFFKDTPTTEIYALSLHDALPICRSGCSRPRIRGRRHAPLRAAADYRTACRSAEHTSELQSRLHLGYRLFF